MSKMVNIKIIEGDRFDNDRKLLLNTYPLKNETVVDRVLEEMGVQPGILEDIRVAQKLWPYPLTSWRDKWALGHYEFLCLTLGQEKHDPRFEGEIAPWSVVVLNRVMGPNQPADGSESDRLDVQAHEM